MVIALLLGSAPMAANAANWDRHPFDAVIAINNAWRIRPDWTHAIFPWDFPTDRQPLAGPGQTLVTEADFVPAQNLYGGFVYAGATMAYTAAYWALHALRPGVIAVYGCDMHYPATGQTHFYGTGTPDPLRADITLRSLEAKSARLMILAAQLGCAIVNLSNGPSRLVFPRSTRLDAAQAQPLAFAPDLVAKAMKHETDLRYTTPSGRYWEELDRFDPSEIDRLDAMWLAAAGMASQTA